MYSVICIAYGVSYRDCSGWVDPVQAAQCRCWAAEACITGVREYMRQNRGCAVACVLPAGESAGGHGSAAGTVSRSEHRSLAPSEPMVVVLGGFREQHFRSAVFAFGLQTGERRCLPVSRSIPMTALHKNILRYAVCVSYGIVRSYRR
jgi:hypothetical protein